MGPIAQVFPARTPEFNQQRLIPRPCISTVGKLDVSLMANGRKQPQLENPANLTLGVIDQDLPVAAVPCPGLSFIDRRKKNAGMNLNAKYVV